MVWAYTLPRSASCYDVSTSGWMLWAADTFADAALARRLCYPHRNMGHYKWVVWSFLVVYHVCFVCRWHFRELAGWKIGWWWIRNGLKIRRFSASWLTQSVMRSAIWDSILSPVYATVWHVPLTSHVVPNRKLSPRQVQANRFSSGTAESD